MVSYSILHQKMLDSIQIYHEFHQKITHKINSITDSKYFFAIFLSEKNYLYL